MAEEVQQVPARAQVEGVGQLGRVLLVEVLLVALAGALALHLVVGEAARAGLELGPPLDVVVPVAARGGGRVGAELLALLGAGDAGEGVLVHLEQLPAVRGPGAGTAGGAAVDVGLAHGVAQGREVARLLEALDGRLAADGQEDVVAGEGADDQADDAGDDAQHDEVDGHEGVDVGGLAEHLDPDPGARGGEAEPAEEGGVDEEEQEGLVVAQADARGQPGAVVVHLEHAAAAGRAVVGAVGLAGLALLAEAHLAVGLDREGRDGGRVHGQGAIAIVVGGAAGRGEDGRGVAPIEHQVEGDAPERSWLACLCRGRGGEGQLGAKGGLGGLGGVWRRHDRATHRAIRRRRAWSRA